MNDKDIRLALLQVGCTDEMNVVLRDSHNGFVRRLRGEPGRHLDRIPDHGFRLSLDELGHVEGIQEILVKTV